MAIIARDKKREEPVFSPALLLEVGEAVEVLVVAVPVPPLVLVPVVVVVVEPVPPLVAVPVPVAVAVPVAVPAVQGTTDPMLSEEVTASKLPVMFW